LPLLPAGRVSFAGRTEELKKVMMELGPVHRVAALSKESRRHVRFEGRSPAAEPRAASPGFPAPSASRRSCAQAAPHPSADETRFIQAVFRRAGLDLERYRLPSLARRVKAALRALHCTSPLAGQALVESDAALGEIALDAFLNGYTAPFRDEAVFRDLRTLVLPELARRAEGARIWSIGCSSGAELFSLALLLAERGLLAGSRLRGSDCRRRALDAAQSGAGFTGAMPAVFEALPALVGGRLEDVLERSEWRREDIFRPLDMSERWDVILCRNLAIYLERAAAAELWSKLTQALRPGGFLVAGRSERPSGAGRLERVAPCIYRLKEKKEAK
jgi:chemotaxis protein methyltransferase CheR